MLRSILENISVKSERFVQEASKKHVLGGIDLVHVLGTYAQTLEGDLHCEQFANSHV
jgi:hypothetical protein